MSEPKTGLLTMEEAASELGVDYYTISRWINAPKAKRLNCIRRGQRYVRISKDHIADFRARIDTGAQAKRRGK
jgi:excisionase family DNA binding protein